mmetsp:Transcript_1785/g.2528  ORF Transcript_1785/g.2528 Transcript_1785/m.2528 type:complete len:235 (+) Transcript_1785:783-1487(+)
MAHVPKNNCIYLFGGLTAQNVTLNDLWRYSVREDRWDLIKQRGEVPEPRCGHSFSCHHDKLFLFGGLKEVTKESNEIFKLNVDCNEWEEIGNSLVRPRMFRTCTILENEQMSKKNSLLDATFQSNGHMTPIQPSRSSSMMDHRKYDSTPNRSNIEPQQMMGGLRVTEESLTHLKNYSRDKFKVFETYRAMTELKDLYTRSCRNLVSKSRKSPNPRPGPIPAPLPYAGVLARLRL